MIGVVMRPVNAALQRGYTLVTPVPSPQPKLSVRAVDDVRHRGERTRRQRQRIPGLRKPLGERQPLLPVVVLVLVKVLRHEYAKARLDGGGEQHDGQPGD